MPWPTANIDTTHMDASSDDASQARVAIKQMADNVNDIKNSRAAVDGIASLDGAGKVPTGQLPAIPANLGGTGQTAYSVGDILYASAAGTLTKLSAGVAGYVLTSGGPGVAPSWQQAGGGLTSGVRMLFQNSAAPTGWTKETDAAYNNVSIRLVTGTVSSGGADDFTTVFGAGKSTAGHALTLAQMPAHTHNISSGNKAGNGSSADTYYSTGAQSTAVSGSAGSGGTHSHGLTLDLKYRDFILAQKD